MKKNMTFICTFIILIGQISCSNENFPENGQKGEFRIEQTTEYDNALNVIKEFAKECSESNETKALAFANIKVKDVLVESYPVKLGQADTLKSKSVNENLSDTTSINIYTVIFEQNGQEGFSIATGDERLTQVYAYTEDGHLSDTTYNIGLAMTLANIPYIIQHDLAQTYDQEVQTKTVSIKYLSYGPYLKTAWGQGAPYNQRCPPLSGCSHAISGCTAIAIAQVVAYFDLPRSRYQGTFNYQAMNQSASVPYGYEDMAAKLVRFVGDKVNMDYGCSSSGAWPKDFRSTLSLWGVDYEYADNTNVDFNKLTQNLMSGRPHITSGQKKKGDKGAHTWVWDGVKGQFKEERGRGWVTYKPYSGVLFNCNWGWFGSANGWYAQANMEQPTNQDYPYLANETQLYITNINPKSRRGYQVENSTENDNLPPF